MASDEVSANSSKDQSTTVAASGSSIYCVPDDLLQNIFQHLSASDLCHVASCSRWLRNSTNRDSLWRPLCQSKEWEHYGTTTDLAKISPYEPSEQATGVTEADHYSVTFQNDRIVTDDNTAGLTSTCRWKGVYMRASHLDRNWATNCSHLTNIAFLKPLDNMHYNTSVDGDLLAICATSSSIHVYDMRKGTLECVVRADPLSIPGMPVVSLQPLKIKDGIMVVLCERSVVRAFDVKSGQELQVMEGCVHHAMELPLLFDGELLITCRAHDEADNIYVWDVKDGNQRHLTDVTMNYWPNIHDWDYRDKMVVAAYDRYIVVWDARSGECLQKLPCGIMPRVKFQTKVFVCVSRIESIIVGPWIAKIWSQDTGECQQMIHVADVSSSLHLINSLIVDARVNYHANTRTNEKFYVSAVYDLSGKRMDGHNLSCMSSIHCYEGVNGCRYPFVTKDLQDGCDKAAIFNVTPNGLDQLFALDQKPNTLSIIWMDEIKMIVLDRDECRLLIHHYW